ncbi:MULTISPECIES: toll/interleukin-1 receptor domain-containing protein [Dermacoccus]|uniref:toll/interleukin-1 receptor domain-containing protein n=1 Tax=Dermacoccus TaxID=57495 RepID=UPI0013F44488|nr:toll/interleukin-1 receptor domain-containing protein [Dermacoccus nishinomiyaensis]NHC32735.1 toll/interleukin-1 receptor domain-containing protein [Dermacoccus nishinomiyaensis]
MDLSADLPTKVFLSYARVDDEALGFAKPMKQMLESRFHATTGRTLRVFLDRDDIALGDNWREKLREGVGECMVFLACVSGNYVTSQNCRDEFIEFRQAAAAMDVSKLLIPVAHTVSRHCADSGSRMRLRHTPPTTKP